MVCPVISRLFCTSPLLSMKLQGVKKKTQRISYKTIFIGLILFIIFLCCMDPLTLILIVKYFKDDDTNVVDIMKESYYFKDKAEQLIDLNNFYFINNPRTCSNFTNTTTELLLITLIPSSPNNYRRREMIRSTWGRNDNQTRVVFLIGESNNETVSNQIASEVKAFGDIVQGNFLDTYKNLTYKHVMALKWVAYHCSVAKHILKVDDDTVVNNQELKRLLSRKPSPWATKNLIMCYVYSHNRVHRKHTKWKLSFKEFGKKYFPPYCAGWAIIYSQDVVFKLLKVAQSLPYFWIDDVFVTGLCAEKIGLSLTPLGTLILSPPQVVALTVFDKRFLGPFLFVPPDLSVEAMEVIWKIITL